MAEPEPAPAPAETIALLFEAMPDLNRGLILLRQLLKDPGVQLERLDGTEGGVFHFGPHRIRVLGSAAALSRDMQQRTIHFSHWPQATKEALYSHRAHLMCSYEGDSLDVLEQLLALYQLGTAFAPLGLLGLLDGRAFNATPVAVLQEMFPQMQASDLQEDFPALLWTNVLKFHRPDGPIWYATRGFDRFGCPNLAVLGQPGEGMECFELMAALLKYMVYSGAELAAGHTAELGNRNLQFCEPYEYTDHLTGGDRLLVVEVLQLD